MSLPAALQRGDIVIAAFPFTDLSSNKRRPAVVLAVRTGYPDVILAFISSVLPTIFETHDLPLLPSALGFSQTGLKVPSVIRLNKLATIDQHLVTRRIGKLTIHHLHTLDEKVTSALGIDIARYYTQERQRLATLLNNQGVEALLQALKN